MSRSNTIVLGGPALRLEGWFTVELIDAKTQRVKRTLRFKNLITNSGMDFPTSGTPNAQTNYLAVGTGSTPPAFTDTVLETEITPNGRTNATGGFTDVTGYNGSPEYTYWRKTRTFFEAQANGNLTELGFFPTAVGGTLFNRQLFRDGTGTPTTVTKTNQEQLRVSYEMRIQPPAGDFTGTFVVSGVTYSYTMRPVGVQTSWVAVFAVAWSDSSTGRVAVKEGTDTLPARSANVVYTSVTFPDSAVYGSYNDGQFYREGTSTFEPATANFATGIGDVMMFGTEHGGLQASSDGPCFYAILTPKIPKDSLKRLTLTVRTTWARA